MLKKILFLTIALVASNSLFAKDPLKTIAEEVDNDLKICPNNQDCISKIDKHLVNLKQLQEQLKSYHMSQIPSTFSYDNIRNLLALNFAPIMVYFASKLYDANTAGPKLMSLLLTSAWTLGQWNDYGYREAQLTKLEAIIKFLENKKKELE